MINEVGTGTWSIGMYRVMNEVGTGMWSIGMYNVINEVSTGTWSIGMYPHACTNFIHHTIHTY